MSGPQNVSTSPTSPLYRPTPSAQPTSAPPPTRGTGDSRHLPRAGATATVGLPSETTSAPQIGNAVVDGARALYQRGYVYPPNLGSGYYHRYNPNGPSVGCCADFVADSYKEMAKSLNKPEYDIGAQMEAKGYNPHYCPSMIQYFQKEQMLLKPPSQGGTCHVGDAVFFNWDGSGTAQHAAIVTKVDAQGRPTQIMESNSFNQPAKVTDLVPGSGMYNRIVAVGRLKDATSNDEAANQLPALGANPAKGGPLPAEGPSSGDGYTGDTGFHDYVQDENVRGGNAGPSNVQASPVAPGGTVPKGDFKALMDKLNAMGIDKAYLDELSKKYGVPVEWILGIMMQESGGDPNAGSPAGAKGLMQLMPGTFGSLGVGSNILDPKQNLEAGVKYFSQMYRQFGDLTTAAGHYNSGPGGNLTNPETAQYIKAVPALAQQAKEQLGL